MPKSKYFYLLFAVALVACQYKQHKVFTPIHLEQIQHLYQQATQSDHDSSYYYLQKAKGHIQSFSQLPDSILANNDYQFGLYFFEQGQLDSASIYFHQAIRYIQDSIQRDIEVDYFKKAWTVYFSQGKYGECISLSQGLKKLIASDDYIRQALVHSFDENIFKRKRETTKALESNQLRVDMLSLAGDSIDIYTALISKAAIKSTIRGGLSEAIEILENLIFKEAILLDDQKRLLFGDYGVYLFYKKAFKKSRDAYLKGLSFIPDIPGKRDQFAVSYLNLAEVSMELEDYAAAKTYLDSVEALGLRNISEPYLRSMMRYKFMLKTYTEDNVTKVFSYMDTIFNINDETYAIKYNQELYELEKANEKEQIFLAEKQADDIKNIKRLIGLITLLILFALGMIIAYFMYRQRTYKFEKEGLQMQQRLLRSQMNPHFTFNTLYAIQNQLKKAPEKARDYLMKFSRLLRLILENSTQNYVQVEKELDALKAYLDLQLLRLPSKFEYHIHLHKIEEDDLLFIPPMLLQPLVENSIEHGFTGINYKGKLNISLERQGKYLSCKIEDNGKGLTTITSSGKQSASTQLISDFLEKTTPAGLSITNKKTEHETGVIVQFLIPYKLTEHD